ncbi:unnamed protein product [Thelazia callipaeda]|uniref:XK-related protein n=1 Tax=Thelazia callipaeda TaxID=103827 RepID=A0A0N5CVB1_THECL|nr:unnamed protein product [Thelazia callipaeda]
MHHSLFYDDLETNSSLLKSAKGKPKGYHPTPITCFDRVIRPCVAELVAVFFCIFIAKVMEYELMVHIMISNNERIIMQALTDSVTVVVMILAFHTVHLSPVITLVELFALTTAWPMCFAIIFIQIIASFVAITVFAMLRFGNLETQMARIVRDVGVDSIGAEYHLVLSQFIGTLLVVTSHLLTTTRTGSGLTAMSRPAASPLSVAAAVFISSLLWLILHFVLASNCMIKLCCFLIFSIDKNIAKKNLNFCIFFFLNLHTSLLLYIATFIDSLLNSTIGWNPLLAFALASYGSISCNFTYLKMQGIFWIGPCLASLFACFLYRSRFALYFTFFLTPSLSSTYYLSTNLLDSKK